MEYKPGLNRASLVGSGSDYGLATNVNLDTGWHYLAMTLNGAAARIYVDGVDRTLDGGATPLIAGSQALHIGRRSGGGDYFRGAIDEIRVSSTARSAAWLRAQRLSMSDLFTSLGPVESDPPQPPP